MAPATPGRPPRGTVLVIEDEGTVRKLMVQALARASYQTLEAADAARARELCRTHAGPIDLVLLDLFLPDGDGVELYSDLVRCRPGLRVLFTSGFEVRDIADAPFLPKPFVSSTLISRITGLLSPGGLPSEPVPA